MRFKTSSVEERNAYSIGELRVLRQLNEYEFGVELWIMREGRNNNKWDYRNLEEHYLTFLGMPILCAFVGAKVGDGHNMRERRDPQTGGKYWSFTDGTAERIVGTLSENEEDFSLQERDGHKWIVAKGRLFSFYAPELVEKIVRTGRMDVSAETDVKEAEQDGEIEVFNVWSGIGVTILGDDVAPAIPGARIAALAAMRKEFNSLKLRAAAYRNQQKPQNNTRKGVKRPMSKQAIARLAPKFEGYRIVGLSEDEMRVALVDAAGVGYTYAFNEEDKGEVIASKINPANLSVQFMLGENDAISADLADILEFATNNANDQAATIKNLNEQLESAKNQIKKMEDAEHDRRVQAVKDMVAKTMKEIRADAGDEEDDMEEEEQKAVENAEMYASMENSGKFCGDEAVRKDLMAAYAEKKMAKAKCAAEKEAEARKNAFAWDTKKNEADDNGGVADMFRYLNS